MKAVVTPVKFVRLENGELWSALQQPDGQFKLHRFVPYILDMDTNNNEQIVS